MGQQHFPALWVSTGFLTLQIGLDLIMVLASNNRGLTNVWFRPTSDLFYEEEKVKKHSSKPRVYGGMNESGHELKAASFSTNALGYNNNGQAYQVTYPPSAGTSQTTLTRRANPPVDEYMDMSNQTQYEKTQFSRQPMPPSYPQTPVSPFN
jgi:hypothetical protein